jgi:hypothetical protein
MVPDPAGFTSGLHLLSRRRGLALFAREPDLVDLLREAEQLAAGVESDEPAALFFASARRGRILGPVALLAIPLVAREQARTVGLELDANDTELAFLRLRVVQRAIDFAELRAWFAARLRPLHGSG